MNTPKEHFSNEILNAYIDGELGLEDNARISMAMEADDILRRRVVDLRKVSDLVRLAFSEESSPSARITSHDPRPVTSYIWRTAASLAFVALGALFGLHIYGHHTSSEDLLSFVAGVERPVTPQTRDLLTANQNVLQVMFHIGRNDTDLFRKILNETDRLLTTHDALDQPINVRVVASHGGLSMFNAGLVSNAQRVRDIKLKHSQQVDFVGCGETYKQWQTKHKGSAPDLVPEMLMVDSGVMELLRRQKQGWTFVSI